MPKRSHLPVFIREPAKTKEIYRSKFVQLFVRTFFKWQQDGCLDMGASLAYYALFSLFPILLVMLSVMGFLLGPETDIYGQILVLAQELLPPSAFNVVETTLLQLHEGSVEASIVGFAVLLFTASGFFNALDRSFEKIWRAHEPIEQNLSWQRIVLRFLRRRVFAFLLVLGSAAILLASMLSKIAIDIFLKVVNTVSSQVGLIVLDGVKLLPYLQLIVSFLLLTLVLMLLFKVLPPRRIQWRDVRLSGLLTALLLVILQQLISNSVISLGSRFKSYGVVGGVMVLMFWIYLTSQIFFLGGEFTYVYARMFGSRQNATSSLFNTSFPS
ncbi:MAG: YihY/virulence factor BrkB family protein [Leptolyngbya sp. SIO4C5]|nr:YihY/virulence factor BrkB family protein [Leptolyngbya sp. SIO4C5]